MLVIKKIKLLLVKLNRYKLLNHVKVGYESSFAVNQKKPMLVDKKYIEWKEDLTLPLYLHKPLQFQFYPKHEFGYNPEQINSMGYGSATIVNFDKKTFEGEVLNSEGQLIGRFAFEFKVMNDKRIEQNSEVTKTVNFSSILAQLDLIEGEAGYLQFSAFGESVYTPQIKIIDGQLLYVQPLVLPIYSTKSGEQQKLKILVYVQDLITATGQLDLRPKKKKKSNQKYKKVHLYNKITNEKCGLVFIDYVYHEKSLRNGSTVKLPSIKSTKTLEKRSVSQKNLSGVSKLNDDGLTSVQLKGRKRKYDIPLFRIGEYSYAKPTIIENKYKEYQ